MLIINILQHATKSEQQGRNMRSVVRTLIEKSNDTEKTATLSFSYNQNCWSTRYWTTRYWASRVLLSRNHCESTFTFVYASVDLSTVELVWARSRIAVKENLVYFVAHRHEFINEYLSFDFQLHNFLEFCRCFRVSKGKLVKQILLKNLQFLPCLMPKI